MVKNMYCSCREPGFSSQRPHDRSPVPVSPLLGNPVASSGLHGLLQACGTYDFKQANTCTHKIDKQVIFTSLSSWSFHYRK